MSTVRHAWDQARKHKLVRRDIFGKEHVLDPGVNYFVRKLEALGATTYWSCEGHPKGFYIVMQAPARVALAVSRCGHFTVCITGNTHAAFLRCTLGNALDEDTHRTLHALSLGDQDWWSLRLYDFSSMIRSERSKRRVLREATDSWEQRLDRLYREGATMPTVACVDDPVPPARHNLHET